MRPSNDKKPLRSALLVAGAFALAALALVAVGRAPASAPPPIGGAAALARADFAGDLSPSRERWIRRRRARLGGGIPAYAGMTGPGDPCAR